jgi:eukaryotic-like serine/threonine-protein kinase
MSEASGVAGMTPERWARVEEVLDAALEVPAGERVALLDRECAGDAALRHEVESLLAEHDAEPGFLDGTVWQAAASAAQPLPERIGSYRILRVLGRGGMGQIYLAEREAPGFRQQVALKVVRRGMDTDDLLARFRAERQILASLDHPNIARLLDVGSTDEGLPYFVMEHVDGEPLLDFCDARQLDVPARLRLFSAICDAVHHAHRSLVVHRDLKPQNILVTAEGVPKLLDFGIAKILNPEWQELASRTRSELRLLTPDYSAPEQFRGEAITTATDVYGLGILLYQLLAGRHPFEPAASHQAQLERHMLGAQPPAPSTVVNAAAAAARRATTAQLRRRLAGDLDIIVLTAMRPEPAMRYASALALAADIGHHLAGRPITARTPTLRYRTRKFVRRNPVATVTATAALVLLIAGTAITLYHSRLLRAESLRVQRERDKAVQVRGFLLEMFGTTGPDQPTGDSVTARQLLDRRAASLDATWDRDPEMRAELMYVLAEGYEKLGLFDQAERLARDALDTRRTLFAGAQPDVVASLNQVGWLLHQRRQLDEAESTLRDAVALGRLAAPAGGDAALARALNDLGVVREARRDLGEAAALYRESLEMRRRVHGGPHIGVAATMSNLAVVRYRSGDLVDAIALADSALELLRVVLGPDHPRTMIVQNNLAAMHGARGDNAGAAAQHRDLLERRTRLLGERHPLVALSMSMLAAELLALQAYDEAEALLHRARAIQETAPGAARDNLASTLRVLGDVQAGTGRHAEALDTYRQSLEQRRQVHGAVHVDVAAMHSRIARELEHLGDGAAADATLREAVRIMTRAAGETAVLTLLTRLDLAEFLLRAGQAPESARELDAALRAVTVPDAGLPATLAGRIERLREQLGG